ncbi:MAG: hypothetical protein IPO87_02470 [Flavobacteriales bacterium]|nr:hypothetical protein [Flavobacteriales bacterium]
MERERLTRLVAEPGDVARADLKDLHSLAEQYPWFAGAQLLRSIGEQRAGDVRSEETLHTAAVHVPSRRVLFDLVAKTGQDERAPLVVVRTEVPLSTDTNTDELKDEPLRPASVFPPELLAPLTVPVPLQEIPEPTSTRPDPLELQIMEVARASAYDLTRDTVLTELPENLTSTGSGESIYKHSGIDRELPPEVDSRTEEEAEPFTEKEEVKLAPLGQVDLSSRKLRFTDWLDQDRTGTSEKDISVPAPKGQTLEDQRLETTELISEVTVPTVFPKEPIGTKDLIDRFIQQQNPAAATKVAFYTPQQAAKRSLDDSTGLVTETLARIYVKQGNLPKAIDTYHRLAIKYPAKSAFFAALAKELEGQLNH